MKDRAIEKQQYLDRIKKIEDELMIRSKQMNDMRVQHKSAIVEHAAKMKGMQSELDQVGLLVCLA